MPRLPKPLFLSLIAAVLLAGVPALMILRAGGAFRVVDDGFEGSCEAIGLPGIARDIQVDRERGVAYLSVFDRDIGNGTVMLLDLNLAKPAPRAAMSRDPPRFSPKGIGLLTPAGEPARLLVVSAPDNEPAAVEIAEQHVSGTFVPTESLRHADFGSSDLLAPIGADVFFTVDHRPLPAGFRRPWALFTKPGTDSLIAYDAGKVYAPVKGLAWASGLAASPDAARLYVAELLSRRLRIYRLNERGLMLERSVDLDSAPARLSVDSQGVIWMTAYPKVLRYFARSDDSSVTVPTQVLRFDPREAGSKPAQVFADDGARISGGAALATWRDALLIASAFDKKVLLCKMVP